MQLESHIEFTAAAANTTPAIIHIPRPSARPMTLFVGVGATEAVAIPVTPGRVVAVAVDLVEVDADSNEAEVVVVTTSP